MHNYSMQAIPTQTTIVQHTQHTQLALILWLTVWFKLLGRAKLNIQTGIDCEYHAWYTSGIHVVKAASSCQ